MDRRTFLTRTGAAAAVLAGFGCARPARAAGCPPPAVQLYTAFIYQGPRVVRRSVRKLEARLARVVSRIHS